ncbi:MAG TPA: 3'-5' exonuclease [Candidatus Paceibacterota bacterium]|nr:3'-5' exonuclease [Candidatus Paceibacterota bacterium]
MKGKRLAFVDLETTGINPFTHEIIEIGCLIAKQNDNNEWVVVDEFEFKVKPEHIETAQQDALRINRYDESAWMFAHTQEEALKTLSQKCEGCVMVGQNVSFDYAFLATKFGKYNIKDPFFYAKLDTISLAYMRFRKDETMTSFTLRELCERLGIKNEKAHSALADIRATYEIFKRLMII